MTTPIYIAECATQRPLTGTLQDRLRQTLEPFVYGLDTSRSRRDIRACLQQTIERYLADHGEYGHRASVDLTSTGLGSLLVYVPSLRTTEILRRVSGLAMPGVLLREGPSGQTQAVMARDDDFADGWLFQ